MKSNTAIAMSFMSGSGGATKAWMRNCTSGSGSCAAYTTEEISTGDGDNPSDDHPTRIAVAPGDKAAVTFADDWNDAVVLVTCNNSSCSNRNVLDMFHPGNTQGGVRRT